MASDVTQRLVRIIADVLEVEPAEVRLQSHFFNDLGASSLDIAEMVWRIEDDKSFGVVEIPDEVLERIRCVQDVVDFIEGRQPGLAAPAEGAAVVPLAGPAAGPRPDVVLASDHAGYGLKEVLRHYLAQRGVVVQDLGPDGVEPVDYPEYAEAVGTLVSRGEVPRGILVCGTGIGMSIAANKIPGVRAAHVQDAVTARLARQQIDANVLCLGSRIIGETVAAACVEAFLKTDFTPGDDERHLRRLHRIHEIEDAFNGSR